MSFLESLVAWLEKAQVGEVLRDCGPAPEGRRSGPARLWLAKKNGVVSLWLKMRAEGYSAEDTARRIALDSPTAQSLSAALSRAANMEIEAPTAPVPEGVVQRIAHALQRRPIHEFSVATTQRGAHRRRSLLVFVTQSDSAVPVSLRVQEGNLINVLTHTVSFDRPFARRFAAALDDAVEYARAEGLVLG